jgi:hypothetical protein
VPDSNVTVFERSPDVGDDASCVKIVTFSIVPPDVEITTFVPLACCTNMFFVRCVTFVSQLLRNALCVPHPVTVAP